MKPMRLSSVCLLLFGALTLTACRSTRPYQPPLSEAVFTPDGQGITFTVSRGETCFLYTANLATGTAKRVTHASTGCETNPNYSSDGQSLAYMQASKPRQHAALVIAHADGTGTRTLVGPEADNLKPVFVPQSQSILFLRAGDFGHSSPLVDNRRRDFDLFSVDPGTRQITQLTHQRFYELGRVSVSADGKQILYSLITYPEMSHFLIVPLARPEQATGSLQPFVPKSPKPTPEIYTASWFPDGRHILFQAASEPPQGGNFNYNVYRMTVGSGALEQLTDLTGTIDGLSLSADGTRAVLLRQGSYSILNIATHHLAPVALRFHD